MKVFRRDLIAIVFSAALAGTAAAAEGDLPPSAFFGNYVGQAISDSSDGLSTRDLAVRIRGAGNGAFTVDWTTVTRRADGTLNRKNYSITFQPTPRKNLYGSAMRTDKFGAAVPLDPLMGEPFVWARIEGRTLFVYALHITGPGGYELQTYKRTLTENGLDLEFLRLRDGEPLRKISGALVRVTE